MTRCRIQHRCVLGGNILQMMLVCFNFKWWLKIRMTRNMLCILKVLSFCCRLCRLKYSLIIFWKLLIMDNILEKYLIKVSMLFISFLILILNAREKMNSMSWKSNRIKSVILRIKKISWKDLLEFMMINSWIHFLI